MFCFFLIRKRKLILNSSIWQFWNITGKQVGIGTLCTHKNWLNMKCEPKRLWRNVKEAWTFVIDWTIPNHSVSLVWQKCVCVCDFVLYFHCSIQSNRKRMRKKTAHTHWTRSSIDISCTIQHTSSMNRGNIYFVTSSCLCVGGAKCLSVCCVCIWSEIIFCFVRKIM